MTFGTMEKIETVTVGSGGAASITFSNIPATYDDLVVLASLRDAFSSNALDHWIRFNNNSSNYTWRKLQGSGSATSSSTSAVDPYMVLAVSPGATTTASTFSNVFCYIPNYAGNTNKSISVDAVGENNGTQAFQVLSAGLWANTSAITEINLIPYSSSTFVQHTTATLYGITRVPAGAKATGGVIYDDASYWYHVFTSSGTFRPNQNITCDYLVVAGGGAGGAADSATGTGGNWSGGGGAGGLRSTVNATGGGGSLESPLSLTANTDYTVTIGAGGTGGSASWTSGSNSVFSTITSTGGGAGSGLNTVPNWIAAATGGSGGGGSEGNLTGANGTANQGYAGGTATLNGGGGGGGAGAVGANGGSGVGGAGGIGVAVSSLASATSTGVSNYYAGGGGASGTAAGVGGTGGGGAGSTTTATAGTPNTGGGGGSGSRSGANGGSGIVIVRYTK